MVSGFKSSSSSLKDDHQNLPKGKESRLRDVLDKCIKIGYEEDLPRLEKNRLIIVNALALIMLGVGVGFMSGLYIAGSHSWYYVGLALPIYISVLIVNSKRKHKLAQYMMYFVSLSLLTFLCFTNRRVGAEYGLIAVACSTPLMSKKNFEVYLLFTLSLFAYISYRAYDYFQPFVADPSINYPIVSTVALTISAIAIFIQSHLFRSMVNKFSNSLKRRNQTLNEMIESKEVVEAAFEQKNKELKELTDQLNWIVKQKTLELQTYIDAININICSSIIDLDGDFIKVNEPLVRLCGYSQDELVGKNLRLLDSGDQESFYKEIKASIKSGRTWRGEIKNTGKDGSIFWTDQMIIPMKASGNRVSYLLMLAFPITERKLNEETREKTRLLLEDITFQTSHKIRGPLARIQGLVSLVNMDMINGDELKTIANGLIDCSSELNMATSDLVNFVMENQDFINVDSPTEDALHNSLKTVLHVSNT